MFVIGSLVVAVLFIYLEWRGGVAKGHGGVETAPISDYVAGTGFLPPYPRARRGPSPGNPTTRLPWSATAGGGDSIEEKEKAYSKGRVKAEMDDAKNISIACGLVAGLLAFIATGFTIAASSPHATAEAQGIAALLWLIIGALICNAWKYGQHYKKWKSRL